MEWGWSGWMGIGRDGDMMGWDGMEWDGIGRDIMVYDGKLWDRMEMGMGWG